MNKSDLQMRLGDNTLGERVDIGTDARPVDVTILYALGQKDRAQHIARELAPVTVSVARYEN